MSELTTKTWVLQEKRNFDDFHEFVANRFEEGWCRALTEKMRRDVRSTGTSEVVLPWGTYTAEVRNTGESAVVNIGWEPSKAFLALLEGGESEDLAKYKKNYQDEFDPAFVKLFRDFVAYGIFDPELPENKEEAAKNHSIMLEDAEITYFLNSYALVLYTIAKDKQRDGKIFRLEINSQFPHGTFEFDYKGDKIEASFIANKVFKQIIKDDVASEKAQTHDFKEFKNTEVVKSDD